MVEDPTRSRAARDEEMRHIGGRAGDWVNASIEGHMPATPDQARSRVDVNSADWKDGYETGFAEGASGDFNPDGSYKTPGCTDVHAARSRAADEPWLCCLPLDRCAPATKKNCVYCSLMPDPLRSQRVDAAEHYADEPTPADMIRDLQIVVRGHSYATAWSPAEEWRRLLAEIRGFRV